MTVVIAVCLGLLVFSALLCIARVVRPGALADRVVAVDTLLIVLVAGIAVDAARNGRSSFLDALLVVSLVAYISSAAVAGFIERRDVR